ncbi:MAG: histidinol-phosphatase HisJ family protein [Chloroflexi bacterium]|nr:MAG: histidinol-phosphatase HisJ family protein [Chloroflexota bacterium]
MTAEPPGQDRDLPLDAHLHTNLSPDSDVPIDVYAELAVDRGIAELAITDHVDFAPGLQAYRYSSFEDRERTVREAAERWVDRGVAIRFGCELTYGSRYEDDVRDHLRRHRYDFTIGSVHDEPDSVYAPQNVAAWCSGRPLSEIVKPYFDEVTAAARSGLFDTIGHLDYVKRYVYPNVTPAQLSEAPELYEPILRALVESGTALEVNTSGLRQPPAETYPAEPVVARFRAMGGRAVTTGSDAHRAEALAFGLEAGYRVASNAGFRSLAFRRGAERLHVPLPERFQT